MKQHTLIGTSDGRAAEEANLSEEKHVRRISFGEHLLNVWLRLHSSRSAIAMEQKCSSFYSSDGVALGERYG